MTQKNFNTIAGALFLIIAIVSLYRVVYGIQVWFGDSLIPNWVSWIGIVLTAVLGFYGIKHGRK